MSHRIEVTGDGSHTIQSQIFESTYHSRFGAIEESLTVFIKAGLQFFHAHQTEKVPIRILECGLGTGLNAWLSLCEAGDNQFSIRYSALELYPIPKDLVEQLNYPSIYSPDRMAQFQDIHNCSWAEWATISPFFELQKLHKDMLVWTPENLCVDLLYYDAFGPTSQPELWSESVLSKFVESLVQGGVFVTYCAKGEVRRTLQRLGLVVERLPGPPGKREILRGIKY